MSQIAAQNSEQQKQSATADQEDALVKGLSLIVAAICDSDVVGHCSSQDMQTALSFQLVENYVQLLKGMDLVLVTRCINCMALTKHRVDGHSFGCSAA